MKSAICTLFEGHYHYGVAALANSLYSQGFRGSIYAGYRGAIPIWAASSQSNTKLNWVGGVTFEIVEDFQIHFLPLDTQYHLANYKPHFMLQLCNTAAKEEDAIFYFDPDIVNKCKWAFYDNWVTFGVALVHEVVWNDMPPNHPKKFQWKMVAEAMGIEVNNDIRSNLNSGFIGVKKDRLSFLKMWGQMIDYSVEHFNFDKTKFAQSDNDAGLFKVGDQDLFNLAAMCTEERLSEFGPEGMDFVGGGWLMSHAAGSTKPWKINYFKDWIYGRKPSIQSKLYWQNANGIIKSYSHTFIRRKLFFIKLVSFLSRFYSK